ncbi:MAG: DUF4249 domain-containing protein [Bacteroidota bacterium]
MMNRLAYIALFLSFLALMACEDPIDLGIEEEEPRLVVVSNFDPDSLFKVVVSQSRSALSNDPVMFLDNATVDLFENDALIERLVLADDPLSPFPIYKTQSLRPQVGSIYTIEVAAPDLVSVSASNSAPQEVPLRSFEITDYLSRPAGSRFRQHFMTVTAEIDDPPEIGNFYHLNFFYERVEFRVNGPNDTTRIPTGFNFSLLLENTPNELPYISHYNYGVLISDAEAGDRPLRFSFEAASRPVSTVIELFDRVYVELRSVSEDYFLYHSSLTRQNQQRDTIFAEPVILYNNIENGYGIFAGFSSIVDSTEINQ